MTQWTLLNLFVFLLFSARQRRAFVMSTQPLQLGFSSETYGLVFAVYALAQAICAPFLGYWADKVRLTEQLSISSWFVMITSLQMSIRIVVLFCLAANELQSLKLIC